METEFVMRISQRMIQTVAMGGAIAGLALLLGVAQSGGWENFKLRYFSLTRFLHDQTQELGDLQAREVQPEIYRRIALEDLRDGGPPKDGIPSIDTPQFDTAETTPFDLTETVIGLEINGEARAYPYGILNWHEIVNDVVDGIPVSVTYCPLCDTYLVVERGETTFGVSGKLFQSCLVMFDRSDDSLFAQPWGIGVVGSQVNHSLERIPAVKTTLGAWLSQYPDSKILSTDTGYLRDYFRYPYGTYMNDERIIFPVRHQERLEEQPKAIVSYIWEADQATPENYFSGSSRQFIHDQIRQAGEQMIEFNGRDVRAIWDPQLNAVRIEEINGDPVVSSTAFAFVYPAFFED